MNNYRDYQIEDFLQDELFVQWCYQATPELNEFWQSWGEQYPDKVPALLRAKEIIQSVEYQQQATASEEVYQRILREVVQASRAEASATGSRPPGLRFWRVAAALLGLAVAVVLYTHRDDAREMAGSRAANYVEKYCPIGKKMTVRLKDGTRVQLNADSRLSYREDYGDSIREVTLSGEAFFEVAKDPGRPFIVQSNHLRTRVWGTSFNVQTYPDSRSAEVAVVEGEVQVGPASGSEAAPDREFFLSGGQKLSYTVDKGAWQEDSVAVASVGRWRNGELVFEHEDLVAIAHKLERWYGVEVIVAGPFSRKISFNGAYRNADLYTVLEGITYSAKLNYSLHGDTVYFKP